MEGKDREELPVFLRRMRVHGTWTPEANDRGSRDSETSKECRRSR